VNERPIKRCFMRSERHQDGGIVPAPINGTLHHVEFVLDGSERSSSVARRAVRRDGKVAGVCPWSFKDALSHVGSGHWVEVLQDEQTGLWFIPTEQELTRARGHRLSDPNVPQTQTGMDAW
jgi:hypothetical protein